MAQIELRLGKAQKVSGKCEVMICLRYSRHDLSAKSGIMVNPSYFEYYIDRKKTINPKKPFPDNKLTATQEKAFKYGWVLRKSGIIVVNNKQLESEELKYHRKQYERMEELKKTILNAFNETADKESLTSGWLIDIVDKFHHPEVTKPTTQRKKTFYELAEKYLNEPHGKQVAPLAASHARVYWVLFREVARYEGFIRATDKKRKGWRFDIDTITRDDLQDFMSYLRQEKKLADTYPTIFKKLLEKYPTSINTRRKHDVIDNRGENTVIKAMTRLKSLFRFFYEKGYTTNRPFDGFQIGTEKVGEPIYITIDERNKIADADISKGWESLSKEEKQTARMTVQTLLEQRDIFIFHCFIGCRVGDLIKLSESYINDGMLIYTPHKTKDGKTAAQARVPLHPKALELIDRYRGVDKKGRLFPFITPQKYNDAIKMIFRLADVTRNVEVRNPLSGEVEIKPINEIASSHMARRTFIGNAYFKVQDPNIISKMSGHADGSKAFKRYRNIEDDTLRNVINQIG